MSEKYKINNRDDKYQRNIDKVPEVKERDEMYYEVLREHDNSSLLSVLSQLEDSGGKDKQEE